MRILLTNDDGIHAPGIFAAKQALDALGEVFVVAPERPRSAAGHAITLHKPLRIAKLTLPDGSMGYSTSGTPTDCVTLGTEIVMERKCDLVVSGINSGANLGWDLTYSGTVAAAIEGAVLRYPSIAVSLAFEEKLTAALDFRAAAAFTAKLVLQLLEDSLPPHTFLNVNVPFAPPAEPRGAKVTHQGRREYVDRILVRDDPAGRPYYWQAGDIRPNDPDPGSDVEAVAAGFISVTPVQMDMTAYPLLEQLRAWKINADTNY